jgi:cell wall assembly regulator SMI1
MQKLTRALTREVSVGGERLTVTLDSKGIQVGSRQLSWAGVLCALASGAEPDDKAIGKAVEALREASAKGAAGQGEDVPALLKRLDAWLKKNRKRYHKALLAGADERQLGDLSKALGKPVPDDLAAWLRWHNGQDEDVIGAFVESFNLMSADEIAAAVKERKGTPGWDPAFIPILDDYQDDLVVLDASKPELPVREVWRGRDDKPEVATSMRGWVAHLLAEFEAGKYHEDSERGEFIRGKG